MNDSQLLRYSRHLFLDDIGVEGQARLLAARVLIVGAGGLGSPVGLYVGSAGVGHITIVDHDLLDETNLQRQIAHRLDRVGQPKAASLAQSIHAINPDAEVRVITERADEHLLDELVPGVDLVLDCTDNFVTRHAINRACVAHGKPLVSGAAIGFDGQVSVFNTATPKGDKGQKGQKGQAPCYACVFPPDAPPEEASCATMGVFAPLVGIIGSVQAAEALKLLSGAGHSLAGRLLMLDARHMAWSEIGLQQQPACPVCGQAPH